MQLAIPTTCDVCGAPVPERRKRFCSNSCKDVQKRKRIIETYRTSPEARRKQLARMAAARMYPDPEPCGLCGSTEDVQRHHHLGYDNPLEFVWRCRTCHGIEHRKVEAA